MGIVVVVLFTVIQPTVFGPISSNTVLKI